MDYTATCKGCTPCNGMLMAPVSGKIYLCNKVQTV